MFEASNLRSAHQEVLTLLRAGALEQAEKEYLRLALHEVTGDEDILALGGRILKSKALEASGAARQDLALQAAAKYQNAYRETGGTYTGINTAALYLVGGKIDAAQSLARDILQKLRLQTPKPGEDAYYHMATVAEAHLILGEKEQDQDCFRDAIQLDPHNYEAHATTLRQFEMLLDALGDTKDWLDALRPPAAIHYAGPIFGGDEGMMALDPQHRYALEFSLQDSLSGERIGFAYGALAAGSDILIAEQLLAAGAELHVVQPAPDSVFLKRSVAPFGAEWVERFHKCKEQATSIQYVSKDPGEMDDLRTAFASELAMGQASLRAQALATEAVQILVWDGAIPKTEAGTARDAALWGKSGRRQITVPFPVERPQATPSLEAAGSDAKRGLKAMLFADVRGFGALKDGQIPVFLSEVQEALAAEIRKFGHKVRYLNTWGDGLFIVLSSVEDAAEVALALQSRFHGFDLGASGLPEFLALRIGGHYGPVYEMADPFHGGMGFFGNEVSYAARIEPLTVPGSVYVSEAFACALAVNAASLYRSESVGRMSPRKGADPIKLFSLRKI